MMPELVDEEVDGVGAGWNEKRSRLPSARVQMDLSPEGLEGAVGGVVEADSEASLDSGLVEVEVESGGSGGGEERSGEDEDIGAGVGESGVGEHAVLAAIGVDAGETVGDLSIAAPPLACLESVSQTQGRGSGAGEVGAEAVVEVAADERTTARLPPRPGRKDATAAVTWGASAADSRSSLIAAKADVEQAQVLEDLSLSLKLSVPSGREQLSGS